MRPTASCASGSTSLDTRDFYRVTVRHTEQININTQDKAVKSDQMISVRSRHRRQKTQTPPNEYNSYFSYVQYVGKIGVSNL